MDDRLSGRKAVSISAVELGEFEGFRGLWGMRVSGGRGLGLGISVPRVVLSGRPLAGLRHDVVSCLYTASSARAKTSRITAKAPMRPPVGPVHCARLQRIGALGSGLHEKPMSAQSSYALLPLAASCLVQGFVPKLCSKTPDTSLLSTRIHDVCLFRGLDGATSMGHRPRRCMILCMSLWLGACEFYRDFSEFPVAL